MKITMKIQDIHYGDVAVQALPILEEKLPAEDTAMSKLLRAISHLPEDVVYSLFDAIPQLEKNEIVSLLIRENKEKILAYATQFLQEQQIGLTLQNLAVTSDLVVQLDILDIDYGSLIQKLLPLIQDKLAENHDNMVNILGRIPAGCPNIILGFLPQKAKDDIAAYLINKGQDHILRFAMQAAANRNICLELADLIVEA